MYQWDPVKEVIRELYVDQNLSLRRVMEHFDSIGYWITTGMERGPCQRSYRDKLAQWGYLRSTGPRGNTKGKGQEGTASSEAGSTEKTMNSPSVAGGPSGVSLQAGYSGGAATTHPESELGHQGAGHSDQSAGEDTQFEQFQHGVGLYYSLGQCPCRDSEIMCEACVILVAELEG
ncbi:hypothetical protein C7212DRAFT_343678 [Tuber magnatum]|uniref:Clr5 domain-containing protein n=1 Tax=Tuber magnatum TaxID=42249 RepID=A0A317SQ06_9PEZI|nr:hypothetical protein C7212DRAFT_343678 [Tuber magnatum]